MTDIPRIKLTDEELNNDGGRYFAKQEPLMFIPTGCRLLDCVLGGGWPLSRISNIVGDKSTGKTLLAIEAMACFVEKFPGAIPKYRDTEAAFDQIYATSLGLPLDKIDLGEDKEVNTVEDFFDDLNDYIKHLNGEPGFYVLDTLDALTSESEIKREFGEGSYSTEKAKQTGHLFRMLVREIKKTRTHLMIVSQERDNIGITFGKKTTRSGGRALDFYASQVLWLAKIHTNEQSIGKIKRAVSIDIRASAEKNKISIPYSKCDFTIRFNFGIDNLESCLDFLEAVDKLDKVMEGKGKVAFKNYIDKLSDEEYWTKVRNICDITEEVWYEIQDQFSPSRKRVSDNAQILS